MRALLLFISVFSMADESEWTCSQYSCRNRSGLISISKSPQGWSQLVSIYKRILKKTNGKEISIKENMKGISFSKNGLINITGKDNNFSHQYFIVPVVNKDVVIDKKDDLLVTDASNTTWVFSNELNDLLEIDGCDYIKEGQRKTVEIKSCKNKLVLDLGEAPHFEKLENLMTVRSSQAECKVPIKTLVKHVNSGDSVLKYKSEAEAQKALIEANTSCKNLYSSNTKSSEISNQGRK